MGIFSKKTDLIRKSMKKSYLKHVNLCTNGKIEGDSPHYCGLYGALFSRNFVAGLNTNEAAVVAELLPFFYMDETESIDALSDYAVYRELPYEIEAYSFENLENVLNLTIEELLEDENK